MSTPTSKEMAWMKRMEKVLAAMPPRIGLYTIGDACLSVYDKSKEQAIHDRMDRGGLGCDFCIAVQELDADLGNIYSPVNIHSTAG